jgi:chaperonin cofactor prefoldin
MIHTYEHGYSAQILIQIQQTVVQSQRGLNTTRQQMTAKERELRIIQLTNAEISALEPNVNLYKGVGKMYIFFNLTAGTSLRVEYSGL